MTRILVTGASGFIGRSLTPELRAAGHQVTGLASSDGDIADPQTWLELPGVDVVVHLAARTFVPECWDDSYGTMRTNLLGTVAALDYCRRHKARLVLLSAYVYGQPAKLPINEDAQLKPNNPYALSKKAAEEACRFYASHYSLPVTIIRPFNVYGPGQADHFLVPLIVRQLGEGAISLKDLGPRRDFIYIDDLISAIMHVVEKAEVFAVYNIGSGVSHSVAEVVELIQHVWNMRVPVRAEGERRLGEVMDTVADISRAARGLGWTPSVSLEEGLRRIRIVSEREPS